LLKWHHELHLQAIRVGWRLGTVKPPHIRTSHNCIIIVKPDSYLDVI